MTGNSRGIRSERLRKLYELALSEGWESTVNGRGHVSLKSPDGKKIFTISTTANDGAMGHHYENTRTEARRAGLDVRKLEKKSARRRHDQRVLQPVPGPDDRVAEPGKTVSPRVPASGPASRVPRATPEVARPRPKTQAARRHAS